MKINSLLLASGADIFYDSQFRIVLEDHMTYLKSLDTTKSISVELNNSYKYEGDFYGLLQAMNIPAQNFFIILRMNNLTSPAEYTKDLTSLLVPDNTAINRIRSAYRTKNKT